MRVGYIPQLHRRSEVDRQRVSSTPSESEAAARTGGRVGTAGQYAELRSARPVPYRQRPFLRRRRSEESTIWADGNRSLNRAVEQRAERFSSCDVVSKQLAVDSVGDDLVCFRYERRGGWVARTGRRLERDAEGRRGAFERPYLSALVAARQQFASGKEGKRIGDGAAQPQRADSLSRSHVIEHNVVCAVCHRDKPAIGTQCGKRPGTAGYRNVNVTIGDDVVQLDCFLGSHRHSDAIGGKLANK